MLITQLKNPFSIPEDVLEEFKAACENGQLDKVQSMLQEWQSEWRSLQPPSPPLRPHQRLTSPFQPALRVAARNDHASIVSYLLSKELYVDPATVVATSSTNGTPVHQAFLDSGFDINLCLGHIGDALSLAVGADRVPLVKWLLEHGADPNINRRGERLLAVELAAIHASVKTLALLLEHGAEIHNTSALQDAARYGRTDMIIYLLDHGAAIDEIPDNDHSHEVEPGKSLGPALHVAAAQGKKDVVALLLDRGADCDVKDTLGRLALDLAERNGHLTIASMLRKR